MASGWELVAREASQIIGLKLSTLILQNYFKIKSEKKKRERKKMTPFSPAN